MGIKDDITKSIIDQVKSKKDGIKNLISGVYKEVIIGTLRKSGFDQNESKSMYDYIVSYFDNNKADSAWKNGKSIPAYETYLPTTGCTPSQLKEDDRLRPKDSKKTPRKSIFSDITKVNY